MTGDGVIWGADFWQKVLISGLGTLGSLAIALLLFWLGRKSADRERAKRDEEVERDRTKERYRQAASAVLQELEAIMTVASEPVSLKWFQSYTATLNHFVPMASTRLHYLRGSSLYLPVRRLLSLLLDELMKLEDEAKTRHTEGRSDGSFITLLEGSSRNVFEEALQAQSDLARGLIDLDTENPPATS